MRIDDIENARFQAHLALGIIRPVVVEEPAFPEHDKLSEISESSQKCGEFLDWLSEKHLTLCRWYEHPGEFQAARIPIEELLAEFFEIDLGIIEAEKDSMLKQLREMNR